jgi:hypothetical protein
MSPFQAAATSAAKRPKTRSKLGPVRKFWNDYKNQIAAAIGFFLIAVVLVIFFLVRNPEA